MIASLRMYDRPETAAANDAFWAGIRGHLGYGPARLDRTSAPMDIWQSPDLLFSQTCGLPFRLGLHGKVQLVGTPDYAIKGARPGYCFSALVVRRDDGDDVAGYALRTLAYNENTSQSGWAAPQNHAADMGFQFNNLFCSGSHQASAMAVAQGRVDIAAVDVVSWRMICAVEDWARNLKVIDTTRPTPGLPFITALDRDATEIFNAVKQAIEGLDATHKQTLGIAGVVRISAAEYLNIPTPTAP